MSKEKQIEGLAEAVRIGKHAMCDVCSPNGRDCEECETDRLVNAIYNAGYRKQSEGEWVFNRGRTYGEPAYYCSECFKGESAYGFDNFCPNCGARMKGGAE